MHFRIIFILLLFITLAGSAQRAKVNPYAAVDKIALQLPDSLTKNPDDIAAYFTAKFTTEIDKARAIFIWLATNIQYDVENMFAINFYESITDKIEKPLKTRKGICENYAALFNDISQKTGLRSFMIDGYTKQNGFADYIPHAWCTANVDNVWYMFDPTWGSGYISNGKFIRKINEDYFMVKPEALIRSHMPFDFMWEFLNYPVTNQEFYEGKTKQDLSKPYFNYVDSIYTYQNLNHIDRLKASANRIERNGVKNSLIYDRLQHIKLEIEQDRQKQSINLYNSAVADYNGGINKFNDFINYRNKQFNPLKSDAEIQAMLDTCSEDLNSARSKLGSINEPDANTSPLITQLTKSIDDASTHLKEQQDWLHTYFSKNKSGRKSMFYEKKITWFGVPLN